jgi:hypothetical protein
MNWQVDKTNIQFRMYRLQIAADQIKKGTNIVFVKWYSVFIPYLLEHRVTPVHSLQFSGKYLYQMYLISCATITWPHVLLQLMN